MASRHDIHTIMGRFFLHIANNGEVFRDVEGLDCDRLVDARAEAARVVLELLREGLWSAQSHTGQAIDIADSSGAILDTVSLWQTLEGNGAFGARATAGKVRSPMTRSNRPGLVDQHKHGRRTQPPSLQRNQVPDSLSATANRGT